MRIKDLIFLLVSVIIFIYVCFTVPLPGLCADGDNILSPMPHHFIGTVIDPDGIYAIDHEICLWPVSDANITITYIKITCNVDPGTELAIDLKYADDFIGQANIATIAVCDTTSGTTSITSGFNDATVPSGKVIGWVFDGEPDSALTQFGFDIQWDYD